MADAAIISIEAPSVARTASCAIEAVNAARLVNRVTLASSARVIVLSFVMSIRSMDINLRTAGRGSKLVVVRTVFAGGQECRSAAAGLHDFDMARLIHEGGKGTPKFAARNRRICEEGRQCANSQARDEHVAEQQAVVDLASLTAGCRAPSSEVASRKLPLIRREPLKASAIHEAAHGNSGKNLYPDDYQSTEAVAITEVSAGGMVTLPIYSGRFLPQPDRQCAEI